MKIVKVGHGIDVHPIQLNTKNNYKSLYLCGVEIDSPFHLVGHSDADVVFHALVDAILGALGIGDIGDFFPPTDETWKGASSTIFVNHACKLLKEKEFLISNIDINILAEVPKITPYKNIMKSKLSNILNDNKIDIDTTSINIKATTFEKLGFIGNKEGIVATCTVCIYK